jgi:cytochrome b561
MGQWQPREAVQKMAEVRGWLAAAAKAGHGLLYLLLIAMPISGWYAASRMGVPVSFLSVELPALAAPVQGHPGLITDLHENAGTA